MFFRLLSIKFRPKKTLNLSEYDSILSYSSFFFEQNLIGNDREASYLMALKK